jgi:tetratricopeptide (TPR) repeat protein
VKVEFPDPPKKKVAADEAMPDGDEQKTAIPKDVERKKISGVFSSQTVAKVGTGTTTRKTIQKAYWFAEEPPDSESAEPVVMVQPLNKNNVPAGPKEQVPLADFLERFNPEIEYHQKVVFPKMKEMSSTIQRAESQRDQGALYSAEFEFNNALDFDEGNVRANFGLGLTYMERGDSAKAADIFERVVGLDAAFTPEHKHLFNEFGINLRKSKLLDQAVDYYTRALEISQNDENLHYNVGRAYFERGDIAKAIKNLRKALKIYPDFAEAKQFLQYIEKQKG